MDESVKGMAEHTRLEQAGNFINRVGFPVVAFLLMFWMVTHTMERVTGALDRNTSAVLDLSQALHDAGFVRGVKTPRRP